MERHQGLVKSVCQRILRKAANARDAVQATLLALARKARPLRISFSVM
ncbi:MAG: hypothetical protein NT138_22615 [Planctomycetales bacterium]|nr:hypothetical protein [Planctomycetales bacterium]